jgi:cobalt-zinc-cadmium efflux system membrane fusion protein
MKAKLRKLVRQTLVSAAAAGLLYQCGHSQSGEAPEKPKETRAEHENHSAGFREVMVTEAMARYMGLSLEVARTGRLSRRLELPGEVTLDQDRVVHVAARFSGIALRVRKNIGNTVASGDTLAVMENNENLNPFALLASHPGTVIQKHLVPGEFVEASKDLFVIADLSQVWIQMAFFGQDAEAVVTGAKASIMDLSGSHSATGIINYISPVHDEGTRSLTARMVLPNPRGFWKPGALVRIGLDREEGTSALLVPAGSVQILEGRPHVFIPQEPGAFAAKPVRTGSTGGGQTEILEGLAPGDSIVAGGAFSLKAHLTVQSLGEGDGHAH